MTDPPPAETPPAEPPPAEPPQADGPDALADGPVEFWHARRRPLWPALLVALVGLAVIFTVQFGLVRERIEDRLAATSRQALVAAGFTEVDVTMRGRDALLVGSVPSGRDVADVIGTVEAVRGVRAADFEGEPAGAVADASGPASASVDSSSADSAASDSAASDSATAGTASSAPQASTPAPTTDDPATGASLDAQLSDLTERLSRLDPITFAATSNELTSESYVAVASVAQIINGSDPATRFSVTAHTDGSGPVEDNDVLSEKRARAVVAALVAAGVAPERLQPVWFGERQPAVTPEVSEADKAANRRVEVVPVA